MGLLGSEPRLVYRIGPGVRVSASFQTFALRILLHSVGVTSGGDFLSGESQGMSIGGNISWSHV